MLGQPVYFLTPDVVGVHLTGALREGVTATDLVLHVTEMLRKAKVVGKFVEFFGEGAASLPVTDRATIANMAPEYGATMGFFPVDEETCHYLLRHRPQPTSRSRRSERYYQAQGLFGIPRKRASATTATSSSSTWRTCSRASPARSARRTASTCRSLKKRFRELSAKPRRRERLRRSASSSARPAGSPVTPDALKPERRRQQDRPSHPARRAEHQPEDRIEMMNNRPTPDRVDRRSSRRVPGRRRLATATC